MTLPTFRSLAARRQEKKAQEEEESADGVAGPERTSSERTLTPTYTPGVDIKRATSTRRNAIIVASISFVISVVFLILVCHLSSRPTLIHFAPASKTAQLTTMAVNDWQHQQKGRNPQHLLLQNKPRKHNPRLHTLRHHLRQLASPLPGPPRFLPSRPLELLRRLRQ